jgi:mono/diheme cytochrome c family protein
MTRARAVFASVAVVVLVITVLVAVGVGQGSPPPKLAISRAAIDRELAAVQNGSPEVKEGEALFSAHGCNACHTMAAGNYDGLLGPRLDVQSQGDNTHAIMMNIEQPPDDDKGYEAGLMPENYAKRLSRHDLLALATFIHAASAAAKGSGGSGS